MTSKTRAKLTLGQREDGTVQVEILTSTPLGPFRGHDRVYTPAEYLAWDSGFQFNASAADGEPWRCLKVRASAPVLNYALVDRIFDLSEGSHERAMIAAMVGQKQIPVVWVNEDVEILHTPPDGMQSVWREALETTEGISAEAWRAEIEELLWRQSDSWRPGPRPKRQRRHTARPPKGPPLPFFAKRSGAIPRAGAPELAGVTLPRGSRQPARPAAYWASDDPVENIEMLAPWLASIFDQTGLWPLLWRFDEDPQNYMFGHGDINIVDAIDLAELLEERWPQHAAAGVGEAEAFAGFPGLAAETPGSGPDDPFPTWAFDEPGRLLLVPCNRPADAITTLGGVAGDSDAPVISTALRSWEQRFGAVVYEVAPALVRLSVARPPQDLDQALKLAAEQHTITANTDSRSLRQTAEELLAGQRPASLSAEQPSLTRDSWDLGW
jgi:hypothetical protein